MAIDCTFEEFKRMAKEFHEAAQKLSVDELNSAWKCLGLGYLGMNEPMWGNSAAALMRMEARTFTECDAALRREVKP